MDKIKKCLFVLITSPLLVWTLTHPMGVIKEWLKLPLYVKNNVQNIIGSDKLAKVDEERWNAFGPQKEELVSKLYYNKGTVIIDDFFTMLTYLSPRLYFQSGDGSSLSPPRVEPIAIPLFFFWTIGIVSLIRRGKAKYIFLVLLFAVFAYIFGQRNMAYLLPILISYVIIATIGIDSLGNNKAIKFTYFPITLYGLYILGRAFLLK